MIELHHHMMRAMSSKFRYGENDCVLFIGRYFEKMGAPIFKTIEETIQINKKNWPKSFSELQKVALKNGFSNVGEMHEYIINKIGFKKSVEPKDGDLVMDDETFRLGLGWHGGGAFLEANDGIVITCKDFEKRWTYDRL